MLHIFKPIRTLTNFYRRAFHSALPEKDQKTAFWTQLSLFYQYKTKPPHQLIRQDIYGRQMRGYNSSMLFLFGEVFIETGYFFRGDSQKEAVIFDCGANVGMSMMFFTYFYPRARVVAFEPHPEIYAILQQNIDENRLTQVKAVNVGLAAKEGTADFFVNEDKGSLVSSLREDRGGTGKLLVKLEKISDYMLEHRPDWVKMDVEGAEIGILEDLVASNTIGIPDQYIIEYHHQINNDPGRLSRFLSPFEAAGYDYHIKSVCIYDDTFQDILIHFYKRI